MDRFAGRFRRSEAVADRSPDRGARPKPHQPRPPWATAPNRTGLPDRLKGGIEALSGFAMDDVRVHRNSPAPARMGALAYACGSDIHLGPGQEAHLPHEAWHVVQQMQGRVNATANLGAVGINEDAALESEADRMGARAASDPEGSRSKAAAIQTAAHTVQRQVRGLERFTSAESIPDQWIDAFIADITDPAAHLYQSDIETYLDEHAPGWRGRATLTWEGNHWNVALAGREIRTRADGNCGAAAAYAIQHGVGSGDPNNFSAPEQFVIQIRGALRDLATDRTEIAARIATEIARSETLAETGFGPQLYDMLRPHEITIARLEEGALGAIGSGGSEEKGSEPGGSDEKAAVLRMEAIFRDLDFAKSLLEQIDDLAPLRGWLIAQQGSGPELWQEALNELQDQSSAEQIEGVFAMMAPLGPEEATQPLKAKVEGLLVALRSARQTSGSTASGGHDYTEKLAGPMGRLATALEALKAGQEPAKGAKDGGGESHIAKLIAGYEETFRLDAEWPPGAEYFDAELARRAVGFFNLMGDLADTLLAMSKSQRSRFRKFIAVMQSWQDSTCHNAVVQSLKLKLPK